MNVKQFADNILLPHKRDTLRVHLYLKLLQFGIRPFENDMDLILELYQFGGYRNSEEQARFIATCLQKRLKKSEQSVRNTLSKYVNIGVFEKPRNMQLFVSERFIPLAEFDKLLLSHNISHRAE
jgi:hypothetical protein